MMSRRRRWISGHANHDRLPPRRGLFFIFLSHLIERPAHLCRSFGKPDREIGQKLSGFLPF
jgi:hypothetical protein